MRRAKSAIAPVLCAIGGACTQFESQGPASTSPARSSSSRQLELPASGVGSLKLLSNVEPIAQVFTSSGSVANFLLDTGASECFLGPGQAQRWNLAVRDVSSEGPPRGVSFRRRAVVPLLFLGDMCAKDVDAWILDSLTPEVQGIVGLPILFENVFILDGRASTATFVASENAASEIERRYPDSHWCTVPLILGESTVCVELSIAGQGLRFIVDTGSTTTMIDGKSVRALGLKSIRKETFRTVNVMGDRLDESDVFRVEGLMLGHWTCDFETTESDVSWIGEPGVAGLLGYDFMSRIPCIFDFANRRMLIRDADPGCDAHLDSTMDEFAAAWFEDPMPENRMFAAESTARTGRRRLVSFVAGLLDDPVPDVRHCAAAAIGDFAQENWPADSRVARAKEWWSRHRDEPEYHFPFDASE